MRHRAPAFPAKNAEYNSGEPGIGKEAAAWLATQKVVAVGSDTWAVEVIPSENPKEAFMVHNILLTDNGIQFRFAPRYADGPTARYMTHMFDMRCRENGVGLAGRLAYRVPFRSRHR